MGFAAVGGPMAFEWQTSLLSNLSDDAGADGAAAFADGKAQLLLHGDGRNLLQHLFT
jgi:hypothetical protein